MSVDRVSIHTAAGGPTVRVVVAFGVRPRQLHPVDSCDAANAERAGMLMRFSIAAASSIKSAFRFAAAGHWDCIVWTVTVEVATVLFRD